MPKVIVLPVVTSTDADERGQADNDRKRRLFDWALDVIKSLGLDKAVTRATSIAELRAITLDLECTEITLAIRDALYPASGCRLGHFQGLREGGLKLILKNRFSELKSSQEAILRRRNGKTGRDWTDDLILDKAGKIQPILANLVLILTHAPKWNGVLAFNEFAAGVIASTMGRRKTRHALERPPRIAGAGLVPKTTNQSGGGRRGASRPGGGQT
jgi:hypothetical protein